MKDCVPHALGGAWRREHFEAVLPGVARPRDRHAHAGNFAGREPVVLDARDIDARQRLQHLASDRALQGDQRVARTRVDRSGVPDALDILRNPVEVLDDVRGIDHQHEVIVCQPVGQHIVDERPGGGCQRGILGLVGRQPRGVVGGDVLDSLQRVRTGNLDFAHVRDVEQSRTRANGHVLIDDAGVFDGHVPAGEVDHARAERAMSRVQRRLLESARGRLCHQI